MRRDGSIACWGLDSVGQATPPAGEFATVSAGTFHTCGVKRDGSVACWGDDEYGQATPPGGEFASVIAGDFHTCGVQWDGSIACWGFDSAGEATAAWRGVRLRQRRGTQHMWGAEGRLHRLLGQ